MKDATEGDRYKFEVARSGREPPDQGRPVCACGRGATEDRFRRLPLSVSVERRRLDARPRRAARQAGVDLRGTPAVVAAEPARGEPLAHLPRARARTRRARDRARLHARRAATGDAPPVLGLVGLPGNRLLRAAVDARRARRLPLLRRPPPLPGDRRHPRLGARALPAGRVRARPLRRHRALRARGPASRRASGLGHARLQPWPERGAQLPDRERAVLAPRVPRRRAAGRRGRLDAVPRLLARGGRVGAERVRRARGSGRDLVPPRAERGRARARTGGHLGGGGIDGVAGRLAADLSRRPRASGSSGTWAGCTTRSSTSRRSPSIGATTTTSSPSRSYTPGTRTSSCLCPTTRSCTARARCSGSFRATSGSGSRTCARSTG